MRFFLGALRDFTRALQRVIPDVSWAAVLTVLVAIVAAWWVYVPIHELFHVLGCVAVGGSVDRLEISPEYGAALLARVFPFVAVGSDYPGQLVGFDTRGNDLIYLLTVFAPYLLTIFVGVPLLCELGRRGRPQVLDRVLLGAAIPVAFAPFINLVGDYYELGSIPVSRVTAALIPGSDPARWRSDDLVRLAGSLAAEGGLGLSDSLTLASGALLGAASALATYWLGGVIYTGISSGLDSRRGIGPGRPPRASR